MKSLGLLTILAHSRALTVAALAGAAVLVGVGFGVGFAFVGFAAWTYHSQAVSTGTESLVQNQAMVTKIYYPKLASPLASALAPSLGTTSGDVGKRRRTASMALRDFPALEGPTTSTSGCCRSARSSSPSTSRPT